MPCFLNFPAKELLRSPRGLVGNGGGELRQGGGVFPPVFPVILRTNELVLVSQATVYSLEKSRACEPHHRQDLGTVSAT